MIGKEEFINLIQEYYNQQKNIDDLDKVFPNSFDIPLIEYGWKLFDKIKQLYFTEEGVDWLNWWIYEKDRNPDVKAWYEDHDEIPLDTLDELWDFIKQYRK